MELEASHNFFSKQYAGPVSTHKVGVDDSDGLVSWVGTDNGVPADFQTEYDRTYLDLSQLLSIANDYKDNKVPKDKKYDPSVWDTIYAHFPIFGAAKMVDEEFNQTIIGVEIAVKFLSMMLDAIVLPEAGVADFGKFLSGIGDDIKAGVDTSGKSYNCCWNNMTFEFVDIGGGQMQFVPKLKLYVIKFEQANLKITTSCSSYEQFSFKLLYKQRTQLFNWQTIPPGSDLRKSFDAFINKQQKKQIEDDSNFFSGSFPGSDALLGASSEKAIATHLFDAATLKKYAGHHHCHTRKNNKNQHKKH